MVAEKYGGRAVPIGATDGIAYLGTVDGKRVAIVVATAGEFSGKVVTAIVPDTNQLFLMLSR